MTGSHRPGSGVSTGSGVVAAAAVVDVESPPPAENPEDGEDDDRLIEEEPPKVQMGAFFLGKKSRFFIMTYKMKFLK